MYLRMTFNAYGDEFKVQEFISQLKNKPDCIDVDKEYSNQLAFKHPNEFSQEYFDEEYENYFLTLIQSNIQELKAFGAVDFNLFIEAYYSDQCNFEILSPQFFHYLNKYQIRLPISVYYVPDNESKSLQSHK